MTTNQLPEKMQGLRKQIDTCDDFLVKILAYRFRLVNDVRSVKKIEKLPAVDPVRFQEIIDKSRNLALAEKLDPDLVEEIFQVIHKYSVKAIEEV